MESNDKFKVMKLVNILLAIINKMKAGYRKMNDKMEGKYAPTYLALASTSIAVLITVSILFVPNYLGVANDGSTDEIMNAAHIYYLEEDAQENYNNYFIKSYSNIAAGDNESNNKITSHIIIIKIATAIDNLITGDTYFDIRFLGFLYMLLYIPSIFLIIQQACLRVKSFSEGVLIAAGGVLIFSDVGYVTYFNSFYPEAIWFITLLYCVGFAMSFQRNRSLSRDLISLVLFLLSASVLSSSKWQCSIIGFIFAAYCIQLIFIKKRWIWTISCVIAAFILSFIGMVSISSLESDFNETSKFHAMTRGVLFEASDPSETLAEFGIASSYELLADASAYDYLPLVRAGDDSLSHGFLDKYTTQDIAAYYMRHPGSLIGMIDVAIASGINIRRTHCGNYEKSVGFPMKARSILWSVWSSFKATSAPRTVGYLFLLTVAIVLLFRKGYSLRPVEDKRNTVFLNLLITVLAMIVSQAILVIIYSGDAEMVQHTFLIGFGIDIMTYYAFSEVLHKIKIA